MVDFIGDAVFTALKTVAMAIVDDYKNLSGAVAEFVEPIAGVMDDIVSQISVLEGILTTPFENQLKRLTSIAAKTKTTIDAAVVKSQSCNKFGLNNLLVKLEKELLPELEKQFDRLQNGRQFGKYVDVGHTAKKANDQFFARFWVLSFIHASDPVFVDVLKFEEALRDEFHCTEHEARYIRESIDPESVERKNEVVSLLRVVKWLRDGSRGETLETKNTTASSFKARISKLLEPATVQCGTVELGTQDGYPEEKITRIRFPKPFKSIPTICVAITHYDMDSTKSFRFRAYVNTDNSRVKNNVTASGFNLHTIVWAGSKLYGATVSWVATTSEEFHVGTFGAAFGPQNHGPKIEGGEAMRQLPAHLKDAKGIVSGLSCLDVQSDFKHGVRAQCHVSRKENSVIFGTWMDTRMYELLGTWFATFDPHQVQVGRAVLPRKDKEQSQSWKEIKFDPPFTSPPTVICNFVKLDHPPGGPGGKFGLRGKLFPRNTTAKGFKLSWEMWRDTVYYNEVLATWVAVSTKASGHTQQYSQ
mmetsp:Transcript_14234/g.34719  ORF Transcript_14234/g.34719 Transcript_14234/m.34719 type:complete len:530 (+) Transcript_14234:86-1675(+)